MASENLPLHGRVGGVFLVNSRTLRDLRRLPRRGQGTFSGTRPTAETEVASGYGLELSSSPPPSRSSALGPRPPATANKQRPFFPRRLGSGRLFRNVWPHMERGT